MENKISNEAELTFGNIKLEDDSITDGSTADIDDDQLDQNSEGRRRKKKKKKKKIHFRSDFVNDESSSDDDFLKNGINRKTAFGIQDMNPANLTWTMWLWYYLVFVSVGAFHAAEYCGEKLADLFGITAPKYEYAINEYHRLRQEEQEEEDAQERERAFVEKQQLQKLNQVEVGEAVFDHSNPRNPVS